MYLLQVHFMCDRFVNVHIVIFALRGNFFLNPQGYTCLGRYYGDAAAEIVGNQ